MGTNGTEVREELVTTKTIQGAGELSEKQRAPDPGGLLGLKVHIVTEAVL